MELKSRSHSVTNLYSQMGQRAFPSGGRTRPNRERVENSILRRWVFISSLISWLNPPRLGPHKGSILRQIPRITAFVPEVLPCPGPLSPFIKVEWTTATRWHQIAARIWIWSSQAQIPSPPSCTGWPQSFH